MHAALRWACLAAAVVWVGAIVCPPNICDTMQCDENVTRESCSGPMRLFKENGGFCGCCPLCVTIIPAGGACLSIRGVPPTRQCIEGTRCFNGTCQAY